MAKVVTIDNMEIQKDSGNILISVNPKIYSIDTILSAAYIFIDRAYVIVDGDPEEEIIVQLRVKDKKTNLEQLGREFNNELINYAFYREQTIKNIPIRAAIVQKAFDTHLIESEETIENKNKLRKKEEKGKWKR